MHFQTRVQNKSAAAIDSTFIDTCEFGNYIVPPLSSGLSEHSAQLIRINDTDLRIQSGKPNNIRKIYTYVITDFMIKLR